jgi:hypothetical protein
LKLIAGLLRPGQLKGASVGLFMRFFSKKDLDGYLSSEQRIAIAEKLILPYTTVSFEPMTDAYICFLWNLLGYRTWMLSMTSD